MIKTLKDKNQIETSRHELRRLGADSSRGFSRRLYQGLFFLRFRKPAEAVAVNKSWDVLQILKVIERHKPDRQSAIYDMGSYNCEIPLALWWRGYRKIFAADFNVIGRSIRWYANRIQFRHENFYESTIQKNSLDVITALSVIEHGFEQVNFFKVCHSLLKPGGLVLLTTDFRREKIEVPASFTIFNLSYMVFSAEDVRSLVKDAEANGFELLKNDAEDDWESSENPIEFMGHRMSFIFLGFRKK